MATPLDEGFEVWLTEKLKSVSSDIDTDVFVSYIIGILDTDTTEEENEESITELLCGVIETDVAKNVCRSILSQWSEETENKKLAQVTEDVGDKLSMMFEKQTLATVKEKKLSKDEADRKAAILAQYGQVSDGEESDQDELSCDENSAPPSGAVSSDSGSKGRGSTRETADPLLVRNVNKEEVQRIEREKRDKAKEEQEKKKEKDKQDRLTQKQKQQERKESEKKRTQKGEKRR